MNDDDDDSKFANHDEIIGLASPFAYPVNYRHRYKLYLNNVILETGFTSA